MADTDRGAYTPPTDAPLSFDARQPVRGARPIPFTLIISALVLVALVVAIVMFYRSGVREAGQPPQTVGAPIGDIKTAASAEAQPQDPAAGLQIYKAETGQPVPEAEKPIFTAPPEAPAARPAPAPVVVTPPPPAPVSSANLRPSIPAAQAPAPKAPPPATAAPVAKVAPPPAKVAVQAPPPKPAPVAAAPKPAAVAAGGAVVQIGAVSSTALADTAWNEAVAAAPGLAAGKGKSIEKIEKNGGTLYRTAVTGFASRDAATAFCNRLKAAGKSCFVR
jgi:outer membrane biosynthesis protein TonB